jgi:predicted ABC-type ATPase
MPFVAMIAGPNGSGKTTLIRRLQDQGVDLGQYINADDIAAYELSDGAPPWVREAYDAVNAGR